MCQQRSSDFLIEFWPLGNRLLSNEIHNSTILQVVHNSYKNTIIVIIFSRGKSADTYRQLIGFEVELLYTLRV